MESFPWKMCCSWKHIHINHDKLYLHESPIEFSVSNNSNRSDSLDVEWKVQKLRQGKNMKSLLDLVLWAISCQKLNFEVYCLKFLRLKSFKIVIILNNKNLFLQFSGFSFLFNFSVLLLVEKLPPKKVQKCFDFNKLFKILA